MPTVFSHAVIGIAGSQAIRIQANKARLLKWSILCAILPDLDVLAFSLGIPYESMWGHRGFSHSMTCAVLTGTLVAAMAFREDARGEPGLRWKLSAYFSFIMLTHGILDAMTDGGLGVAFFSPFDGARYFLSWKPIAVSPIGIIPFFSEHGARALASEILWIWIPCCLLVKMLEKSRGRS